MEALGRGFLKLLLEEGGGASFDHTALEGLEHPLFGRGWCAAVLPLRPFHCWPGGAVGGGNGGGGDAAAAPGVHEGVLSCLVRALGPDVARGALMLQDGREAPFSLLLSSFLLSSLSSLLPRPSSLLLSPSSLPLKEGREALGKRAPSTC